MKILIINGPNMNMLGIREPEIYGDQTYEDLIEFITDMRGEDSVAGHELDFYQSNHEGDIIDAIQNAYFEKYDGIVLNAAAYTHTSIAIMDAVISVPIPVAEVHITDPWEREEYRHSSYVAEAAIATVAGKGFNGYLEAIDKLEERYESLQNK